MTASHAEQAAQRYLVLTLGSTRILLDPSEVQDIEAAEQVDTTAVPPGGRGSLTVAGRTVPVYDLSANLDLCFETPLADRFCVWLSHPAIPLAVLCEKVDMLEVAEALHPLPAPMRQASSPVHALALRPEGLLCQSTAALIIAAVQQQARPFEIAAKNEVTP
jgi:chemotaxis signal transduction protein